LTVSTFFDTHRGGLEIVAGRLAGELARRGFAVTWLASNITPPPDPAPEAHVRPVSVGVWNIAERRLGVPWPVLFPKGIARLWAEVKAADVVLLHDGLYMTSMVTAVAARLNRRPLVVIQHIGFIPYRSAVLRGLMAFANRWVCGSVLASADQVVFISQFVRDYFQNRRFKAEPLLIFNGVDTAVFLPACSAEKAEARARFGLPATGPVALFVGRFVEKKGVQLLRGAAKLRPQVTFAFAGWGVIDPASWDLPNVRVFSDLSGAGLADLYRASDLLVLPSHGEGFPLVVQEALACGLPVVCGDESTGADPGAAAFLDGVDVATGGDAAVAERIAAALDRVLATSQPGDAKRRADFVRQRYAWSAAADRYAQVLTTLTQGRARAKEAA
jgi:glycosyltransferase involved in cell wall biosynthesis